MRSVHPLASIVLGITLGALCTHGLFFAREHFAHAEESATVAVSSEVNRLRDEIQQRNSRLQQIEREIAQYQAELAKVGGEKQSLQNAIRQLELERQKVTADLNYTQNRIGATDLEIQKLDIEISETQERIIGNKDAVGEIIRRMHEADDTSVVEMILRNESISELWVALDELEQVREIMAEEVRTLAELQDILERQLAENRARRGDLVSLRNQYADQQEVLEVNREEKNQLLAQTQNEEAQYQALLAERRAAKERFERELRDLEAQLQFVLDPSTIPGAGTAVFRWPVDSVTITQRFGNTAFAQSGGYNGQGHNGVDFRAPTGTTIRAALAGEVIATNSQVAPMCQYGKWVLVRHANGLTTLYAHLSVVSVSQGQTVSTGDILGYSGETGYALGAHLHFTVYASKAVEFRQYTCNSGITLTIPVAAYSGYLNPLNYLPAI